MIRPGMGGEKGTEGGRSRHGVPFRLNIWRKRPNSVSELNPMGQNLKTRQKRRRRKLYIKRKSERIKAEASSKAAKPAKAEKPAKKAAKKVAKKAAKKVAKKAAKKVAKKAAKKVAKKAAKKVAKKATKKAEEPKAKEE